MPHSSLLQSTLGTWDDLRRRSRDTTNAIEALNRQLRKAIKTKGHFPNEDAARKLIYLAATNAVPALDPDPELDRGTTGVQDALRRTRP